MPGRALIIVENLPVPFDRRVWQECQTLAGHGWEVEVICPQGTSRDTGLEAVVDGVRIHRYPLTPASGGPRGYLAEYGTALWHTARLVRRVTRERPVDVVHLCNPPDMLFLAALEAKRRGSTVIFDQHDLCPELYLSRFRPRRDALYWAMRLVEWMTYRVSDVVISTNESYRAVATGRGRVPAERTHVVRSAPAIERFSLRTPEPALARGRDHLLCYLGVMGPQDGVDYAVRALASLAERRDDWYAVFMGGGDAFDDVVALSEAYGLSDRVSFTGRIPDEDVLRHLSTASVCLAPDPLNPLNDVSTMNKIMEYMAMSRPVVSFDLVEARVSAGDAALYARPNDVAEFADLVSELLDDPVRRETMGEIGRDRVAGQLSWTNSEKNLLAAYESARQLTTGGARPAPASR